MQNTKKILFMLSVAVILFSLSGCEDDEANETPSPSPTMQSTPTPKPPHTPTPLQVSNTSDLCGQWVQFDSEYPGLHQVAIISGDVIEIYWINEEYDMQYLYWSGSFPESESVESSYSWTSQNNLERAEICPISSRDETKEFTYEDGQIYYSTTSGGVTTTVRLEKNIWDPTLPEDEFFENGTVSFRAAGIEFSFPDFFEEDASKATKKSVLYALYHGGSGCSLTFFEYNATPQEFEDEKWGVIEAYMGEEADKISTQDVTVADFPGTAFSYHIINQNNVPINVYGTLVYNPREEKAVLFAFHIPREGDYQNFFNKIAESVTRKSRVGDIKWDLAIKHSTKTSAAFYLVDFDGGIAVHYTRGRGHKVSGIYVGKVSGSLDDVLDIVFETTDGGEKHERFTWHYPDKPGSNLITHLYENGEEDYFIYSETSVSSAVSDVKDYIIKK